MSSAIMESLDWDRTGKTFYLLDTFGGLPSFESKEEFERNRRHIEEGFYVTNIDEVKANFAQWSNIRLIQGAVPETLAAIGLVRERLPDATALTTAYANRGSGPNISQTIAVSTEMATTAGTNTRETRAVSEQACVLSTEGEKSARAAAERVLYG